MSDGKLQGVRLLVVEDEYLVARHIAAMATSLGCAVLGPVSGAAEARRLLDSEPVDGVLLDIELRGGTGYALADELVSINIPFVFVTGFELGYLPERYAAHPHLEKPLRLDRLAQWARRAIMKCPDATA